MVDLSIAMLNYQRVFPIYGKHVPITTNQFFTFWVDSVDSFFSAHLKVDSLLQGRSSSWEMLGKSANHLVKSYEKVMKIVMTATFLTDHQKDPRSMAIRDGLCQPVTKKGN